jgi:hypothetical protein
MEKGWALRQLEPVLFLRRRVKVETDAGRRGYLGGLLLDRPGQSGVCGVNGFFQSREAKSRCRRAGAVVGHG